MEYERVAVFGNKSLEYIVLQEEKDQSMQPVICVEESKAHLSTLPTDAELRSRLKRWYGPLTS